uniref:7TM_GPCR_Srx domain-containing protein n=1 Tax=Parastrongyloides trichosuri TaxID=131310 RepID=A0A0N4ZQ39_PARTI
MVGNLIVLTPNVLWAPLIMTNLVHLPYFVEDRVGQLTLFGWYMAEFSHFLLSINRFFAIIAPLKYYQIFSNTNTKFLIYFISIISFLMIIPYSFHNKCTFFFEKYYWIYYDSPFCLLASKIQDFGLGIFMGCSLLCIDLITIILYIIKNDLFVKRKKSSVVKKSFLEGKQTRLFIQTILANVSLMACCTQFNIIAPYFANSEMTEFIFTTFQWMEYHTFNGIILGLCYKELYLHIKRAINKPKVTQTKIKIHITANVNVGTDSCNKRQGM